MPDEIRPTVIFAPDLAVGRPHVGYGEAGREIASRALPSGPAPPRTGHQHRFGIIRLVGQHLFASPTGRRHEPHIGATNSISRATMIWPAFARFRSQALLMLHYQVMSDAGPNRSLTPEPQPFH